MLLVSKSAEASNDHCLTRGGICLSKQAVLPGKQIGLKSGRATLGLQRGAGVGEPLTLWPAAPLGGPLRVTSPSL